ncbi:MAG: OsmC family protein [bacterium]
MPMVIRWDEKYRFVAESREHQVIIDQPVKGGGTNLGMSPVELFIASLGGCVVYYAAHYMERNHIPAQGLRVEADWGFEKSPYRVSRIKNIIHLSPGFPDDKHDQLLAVCKGCTIHHTLAHEPVLEYEIRQG